MAGVQLRTVTRTSGANRALKDGRVGVEGAELDFEEVPVLVQAFRHMVRELRYDVSEMALTTYLCARAHGVPFTAIPVFLVRGFHHGAIVCRRGSVAEPRELEGAVVGVNRGYTVTTGVWARGILAEEHGVDLDRVTWARSGDEHVADYVPPPNVVPAPGGDLADLLVEGRLAAVVGATIERDGVGPLIERPEEAALDALRRRGFYPINHLVVVRDDLLAEQPDLAVRLFEAFTAAKQRYLEELGRSDPAAGDEMDRLMRTVTAAGLVDPLPYGIGPNRDMLEWLVGQAVSQHILAERPPIESLFAPATVGLIG